ncbi:hypothetical protein TNCV_4798471 [Trichonephila clavipes]|nr:hypothetical protein TNCV_4798471 [Trichonephila clavipes]
MTCDEVSKVQDEALHGHDYQPLFNAPQVAIPMPFQWRNGEHLPPLQILSPSLAIIRTQPTAPYGGTDDIRQRFRETRDKYYFIFSFNV